MKTGTVLSLALILIATVFGCTTITDFEMPDDTDTDTETEPVPYSIDEALEDGPVNVTLGSAGNGVFTLEMDPPVPEVEGGDAALEAMLEDGTIMIIIINDETSTSFNLSDGTMVDGTPGASGEYSVELSNDRQTLDIVFTNDFNGSTLRVDGDYSTMISVQSNDHSFLIESFDRQVEISE